MVAKEKKGVAEAERLVPFKCYACSRYDGTFGPETDSHTHVCETCKELPTDQSPIGRHYDQFLEANGPQDELNLQCRRCGNERDECRCSDNPLLTEERRANLLARDEEVRIGGDRLRDLRGVMREEYDEDDESDDDAPF